MSRTISVHQPQTDIDQGSHPMLTQQTSEPQAANEPHRPWLDHYPAHLDWHATIPVAPLQTLMQEAGRRFPDRPAFDFLGRRTTWSQAAAACNRIAAALQRLGYGKNDRIGLLLPNCPAYPLMFFGALSAGMTIVNCNPLYTERELHAQLKDSQVKLLVTLDLTATYPKAAALLERGTVQKLILCSFSDMLPLPKRALFRLLKRAERSPVPADQRHIPFSDLLRPGTPTPVEIDPQHDIAVLQYTGGTSGLPKGAMLSHASLYANAVQSTIWMGVTPTARDRVLAALPFFHVFAMTTVLLFAVMCGAEIIMLPRFELAKAVRTITRRRPTVLPGVPTMFNAIASYQGRANLTSIRRCISGGAPLPPEVKARFEARTGCVVVEGYGLTETSPCAICNPPEGVNKTGSVGLPMPATEIELRDPADPLRRVPLQQRGEICIRGPQLMLGYWNRPEETRATFTPDGFLRTGDIGLMDQQGYVFIVDRIKDLILAGGFNVYPRMVEDAIYQHPAIQEVTVIGVPDPYRGETVKAFIVLRPDQALTETALLTFLKPLLSPIEMPKQIEFRDTLPKTLVGKLSKKELVAEEKAKHQSNP